LKAYVNRSAETLLRNKATRATRRAIGIAISAIYIVLTRISISARSSIIRRPALLNCFWQVAQLAHSSRLGGKFESVKLGWLSSALEDVGVPTRSPSDEKPLVVLVSGTLGPGGAERQVVNTAIGLQESGQVRVLVLCQALQTEIERFFIDELTSRNIEVRELKCGKETPESLPILKNPLRRSAIGLSWSSLKQIEAYAAFFKAMNPDIVHTWLDEINVKAGFGAVLAGVSRVVLGSRSVAPYNFLIYKRYMRVVYRALGKRPNVQMACNSFAGRQSYAKWLSIPEQDIAVVRNGFDSEFFKAPPEAAIRAWMASNQLNHFSPIVGTVTRFNEEKDPLLWIKSAAFLARHEPQLQFVMVGSGLLFDRMQKYVQKIGLNDRIKFTGLTKKTKVAIAAMDVFVLTSRLEGLPNSVIEAQAQGIPVVMTNAGGAPEAIMPNVTGFVASGRNPRNLADATWKALSRPDWRNEACVMAREFAKSTFSLEQMSERTLKLYRTSMSGQVTAE